MIQKIFGYGLMAFSFTEALLVIGRKLGFALLGYYEIADLFTSATLLMGLCVATLSNNHISVDFLDRFRNDSYRAKVRKVNTCLFVIVFLALSAGSFNNAYMGYKSGTKSIAYSIPSFLTDGFVAAFLLYISVCLVLNWVKISDSSEVSQITSET